MTSNAGKRSCRGLCWAMLLPLVSGGCVSLLGKTTDANELPPPSPATPPCQVVSMWPPEVRLAPDPVHQGQNNPGLVGRIYLFGSEFGWPVTGDGNLVIDLFDETSGQALLLEEWRFDNASLKKSLRKDGLGWGYTLFLPWGTYRPDIGKVRMRVAYRPVAPTALPIYAADTPLTLVHPNPTLLATLLGKGPTPPVAPPTATAGSPPAPPPAPLVAQVSAPPAPTPTAPVAVSPPTTPPASVPTTLAPAAPRALWGAPTPTPASPPAAPAAQAPVTPPTAQPAPPTSPMTPGMEAAMADLLRAMAQARQQQTATPQPVAPMPATPAPVPVVPPPAPPETALPRTVTAPALPSGMVVDLSPTGSLGALPPPVPVTPTATVTDANSTAQ